MTAGTGDAKKRRAEARERRRAQTASGAAQEPETEALHAARTAATAAAVGRVAQEISIQERGSELEVLRASVLVDRRDVPRVDRALDELARNRARDMLFKYLGPLPPHSFVSLRFGAG